jgi:hypothetical protein
MNDFWLYWWLFVVVLVVSQSHTRRRREMGPRIKVAPGQFLEIVAREKGLVVSNTAADSPAAALRTLVRRIPLLGRLLGQLPNIVYVTRSGDYYYYTRVCEPLSLPPDCQVVEGDYILL